MNERAWVESWFQDGEVRLRVRTVGPGAPLILVHGTGADSTTWAEVGLELAAERQVVAYDRRGYGDSESAPVRDYRIHVRDLIALLESLGPADVLGWSSGGNTALAAAVARPELFRSLTVLEAPFHGTRLPRHGMVGALVGAKWNQFRGRPEDGARCFLRWASGYRAGENGFDLAPTDVQAELVGYSRQILAELDPNPFGVMAEFVPTRRLRALGSLPVTWLLGADTIPWYGTLARRALRHVPHATVIEIPKAGHLAHHENLPGFLDAVAIALSRARI